MYLMANPANTTPTNITMNDQQTADRIDARKQLRQPAEPRRLRAFTAPEACGGAGLSEEEAKRLITILETQQTE